MLFDRSQYEPKQIIVASLRAVVRDLDVDALSPTDAVALVDWFAEVERLAVAGKTLAAGLAAQGEPWARSGERSAADWLAKRTGSTVGEARGVLETSEHLADAPGTADAFRSGTLSGKQAEAVASAAAADPTAEERLLGMARNQSLQKLRDESARVRAAADADPEARHERIHCSRGWRHWTSADGARCGSYRMTPEAAALLEAAAQPFIDSVIDEARRTGQHEPFEAHAADGLVAMATFTMNTDGVTSGADEHGPRDPGPSGPPQPSPRGGRGRRRLRNRRELIGIVNLESLRRGAVAPGEVCEIAGIGPVPIETALAVFGEALLRIVIRDGVDIRTVVHTGRTATATQETAVLVRDRGRCIRPSCDLPISEIDHEIGFTTTRTTTLDELGGLCGHDHDLKTRHGHSYRRDADGGIVWIRPDGTEEHERPPP